MKERREKKRESIDFLPNHTRIGFHPAPLNFTFSRLDSPRLKIHILPEFSITRDGFFAHGPNEPVLGLGSRGFLKHTHADDRATTPCLKIKTGPGTAEFSTRSLLPRLSKGLVYFPNPRRFLFGQSERAEEEERKDDWRPTSDGDDDDDDLGGTRN